MSDPVHTGESPVRRKALALTVALLALAAATVPASAEPRFTAQYGQGCVLCHVNPTGGGMRSLYASQFIVPEEMSGRTWPSAELPDHSPEISPILAFGLDLRTLVWAGEAGEGTVLSMQGDLYLDARLGRHVSAYMELGQSGSSEVFGLIHGLPLDGWLKAGRMVPDYGWRFADHQLFGRRYLLDTGGVDSPAQFHGSGLEVGVSPGRLAVSTSLLGETQETGDAYAARIQYNQPLGPINAGLGASVLRRDRPGQHNRAVGGFWYLSAGPVNWLGEIDETSRQGRLGTLVTQEVTVRLRQGFDLRGTYNFQDPDRDVKNGSRERWGAGAVWMPYPFFDLQVMVNRWQTEPGELVDDTDRTEGEVVVHFFY
ncbi:MAG: hypothetical protein IPK64_03195 [bacterium]|nr:hypothetical protein [bacterium]